MDRFVEQFRDAIARVGLNPPEVIQPDGKLHRFSANGTRYDDAGWYVYYQSDVPGGAFGSWREGISESWRARFDRALSAAEEASFRAQVELARLEREALEVHSRERARHRADTIWASAALASNDHPYLRTKGVSAHGVRHYRGQILVPLWEGSLLHSLQFINASGKKLFLRDGRTRGCYFIIGHPAEVLCIAEGYATAATIYEATGYAVAVAFNAGNLPIVAETLRARFPKSRMVICADDDVSVRNNPGLSKAREAAEIAGAHLAVPTFRPVRPTDVSDFNDFSRLYGRDAVCFAVQCSIDDGSRFSPQEWPDPNPILRELRPVPPFDAEVLLPAPLRTWVLDEAERMPCPPDFIAASAIVSLSSVVGARCAIKPKSRDSWLVVPNLWGGIVGDPSAKKTPAAAAGMKPLEALIGRASDQYRAELAEHGTANLVYAAERDVIESRIRGAAKDRNKGDPLEIARELRILDEKSPVGPKHRRFKTNDTTVEKLGELLRDNPNGLLILRDELVGLVSGWDREGREGDRAFFLEAWNGLHGFDTDRIGRGHIEIPNLCVSIFGGIQPDKLTEYLEQATHSLANDGMLQRFQLLVFPDPRSWEWRDRCPNREARNTAQQVFDVLAEF
ncbi:MAG: DUF3987 domain-containing protein, partial [Deltaproteobacteria bacterium]|nr:DUF3987 domain-containing protein [Deltaproteobacteria bacterium]